MNEIVNSLKNIGLSEKESKVYLASLKFGEANVGDIAEEAGLKRPTTYVVLDELRKKGLVLKIPGAKKVIYKAKTPDELYEQSVSNVNEFEKFLPKLRAMSPSKKPIKTLYFEGVDGFKQAMYYRFKDLEDSTDDGFFAKNDGLPSVVEDIFDKWNKDRQKIKLNVTGVTPEHPSTRRYMEKYKSFYTNVLLAPAEDYFSDISIEVTKEFVRIMDGHELKGIIIEKSLEWKGMLKDVVIVDANDDKVWER